MKRPYVQPFRVTLRDGSTVDVCCGPAVVQAGDVAGYVPIGDARDGVCCHQPTFMRTAVLDAHSEALEWVDVHRALDPWMNTTREVQ